MAGDFSERIRQLEDAIERGKLVGTCEVDQIYAHRQHEEVTWKHPRGGQALYLSTPLFTKYTEYMEKLASATLDNEEGSKLEKAMAENMESLSEEVERLAPVKYYNLHRSGHPTVTSGDETVYDRPPKQARLTEEELKELARLHDGIHFRGEGVK